MKSRVFHIVQYEFNPKTGEDLNFNEKNIISAVSHKTIREYAYICHDKDVWTYVDEELDCEHIAGLPRPKHWHCVISCPNAIELDTVAKWFGVPVQQVDVPKGHGAFLDCVEYLTHEDNKQKKLGKTVYSDDCVVANFDFRMKLIKRAEMHNKYGRDISPKQELRMKVFEQGLTLKQARLQDALLYVEDISFLEKLRLRYIQSLEPPAIRINYYISGDSDVGKGACSRALARALFPNFDSDDDIFFDVGASGANFEGYDGQPVIIWNEYRAITFLQNLCGRENVFQVLDTHPTRQRQNVKYSSIRLTNSVNIINSVDSYEKFLDELSGEYRDLVGVVHSTEEKQRNQSYRRIPFIINLHENDFDFLVNKGFFYGDKMFREYEAYNRIKGNFGRVSARLGELSANRDKLMLVHGKMLKIPVEKYEEVTKLSDNEIDISEFEHYGDYEG